MAGPEASPRVSDPWAGPCSFPAAFPCHQPETSRQMKRASTHCLQYSHTPCHANGELVKSLIIPYAFVLERAKVSGLNNETGPRFLCLMVLDSFPFFVQLSQF